MRQFTPNITRRADLKRAIKRAKPDDLLTLEGLASVWGVVKTRFVNVKNDITMTIGFPQHQPGPNNTHLYPAKPALEQMLAYETRNDELSSARQARQAQILGAGRKGSKAASTSDLHTPRELIDLNRIAADLEAREREQGLYIPASDVAATTGEVFSQLSEFCGNLANNVDPNGQLPPDVRERIDKGGATALIKFHAQLKGLMNADAVNQSDQRPTGRARQSRARR
jgi:hypothetical protein